MRPAIITGIIIGAIIIVLITIIIPARDGEAPAVMAHGTTAHAMMATADIVAADAEINTL
jgi:hypothetical protein